MGLRRTNLSETKTSLVSVWIAIRELERIGEPNWLFDCLERGTPEEICEPPAEQELCPEHLRKII